MMMMLLVVCLCSSISAGGAGYYFTTQGKEGNGTQEVVDDEFKAKYQEAMLALENEKALVKGLEDAKTELSAAEQRLADAKLAFESGEFDNDAMRNAALARVQEAESDVETSISRVSEAENKSDRAAIERDTAEKNAASALEVAVTNGTRLIREATDEAQANLIAAQGRLAEVRTDALAAIEKAQADIAVIEAQAASEQKILRENAQAKLDEATTDAARAAVNRENERLNREWAAAKDTELARLNDLIVVRGGELATATEDVRLAGIDLAAAQAATEAAEAAAATTLSEAASDAATIRSEAASDAASSRSQAAIAAASSATPNLTTSTGGPHNGGIIWQSHDIGGRFHSPGGLVWLGGDGTGIAGGHGAWNKTYKFRCEKNGVASPFSPTYGPVNFRTYHNPKIQVSNEGTKPCIDGFNLQVWDANGTTNITSQMKNFDNTAAYNGTDHRFYDARSGVAPKGCIGAWDRSACRTKAGNRPNSTITTGNQTWRVTTAAVLGGSCPHTVGQTKGC